MFPKSPITSRQEILQPTPTNRVKSKNALAIKWDTNNIRFGH